MSSVLPLLLRKRIKRKIKELGAISNDTARTSKELKISESTLDWLVFVKDIKRTEDGRYYVERKEALNQS
jgi:hypothetical protein